MIGIGDNVKSREWWGWERWGDGEVNRLRVGGYGSEDRDERQEKTERK